MLVIIKSPLEISVFLLEEIISSLEHKISPLE